MSIKKLEEKTWMNDNHAQFKSVYKWIINLEASKHMTLHRVALSIYEVITSRTLYLENNSVGEAIGMGFIVVEAIVKDNVNQM